MKVKVCLNPSMPASCFFLSSSPNREIIRLHRVPASKRKSNLFESQANVAQYSTKFVTVLSKRLLIILTLMNSPDFISKVQFAES